MNPTSTKYHITKVNSKYPNNESAYEVRSLDGLFLAVITKSQDKNPWTLQRVCRIKEDNSPVLASVAYGNTMKGMIDKINW